MYKLSSNIQIKAEIKDHDLHYLVLVSGRKTKAYIINDAIHDFLMRFEDGNTITQVFNDYQSKLQLKTLKDKETLQIQLNSFFKDLLKKQWLVLEGVLEPKIEFKTQLDRNEAINQYKIKAVLANKKTTDVYLVRYNKQAYVLKLLNRNKIVDTYTFNALQKGLKAEYGFLNLFNSIYINKPKAYEVYQHQPFLLLEYVKGESLGSYVNHNTLSSSDKRILAYKIIKGFSIIHNNHVYHGDIHLSNVMVKATGQPKIIDFGYANMATSDTKTFKNGGALDFIPPERANRSINHRFTKVLQYQSEVYQIGLLVYYIYTKTLPFEADTWKVMVDEKKSFDLSTYSPFLRKRMPKSVRYFLIKALNVNPHNRYKDACDMLKNWQMI